MMLQRLNNWSRKSLIAVVVLTLTAASLIGSPEVPGKVMQFSGFTLAQIDKPHPFLSDRESFWEINGGKHWNPFAPRRVVFHTPFSCKRIHFWHCYNGISPHVRRREK